MAGRLAQSISQLDTRKRGLCALALLLICTSGCVERRMTIRTDPPGALVYVNGEEIGSTPVSKSFTYYGDREIVLVADGFQTQRIIQPLPAPWWDNSITDFFSENLIPHQLRDEREFHYRLQPATSPPQAELEQRANELRRQGQAPPAPRRQGLLGWLGFR